MIAKERKAAYEAVHPETNVNEDRVGRPGSLGTVWSPDF
jgi:hypothetical protein